MRTATGVIVGTTPAITPAFVAQGQTRRGADDAADADLAAQRLDGRLQGIAARLDRVERLLNKLS